MTFQLKDSRYPDSKFLYQDNISISIGICYWTIDEHEWYFTTKYTDDFYSAQQLREISDILQNLNTTIPDPFNKGEQQ